MGGGRQAWCPRCDELRSARPGAGCPVCGRQLLALPAERPGQPEPRRADRIARRLRALAPAAGAAGVAVLVLAVVASAFAAGRLTRTTPQAPAAATATTSPRFLDEGPETGRRDLNWEAQASGLTVRLRSLTVGSGFTRLELHVDGVRQGRGISALEGLRIRDDDGNDLLPGGELASIATAASRPAGRPGIDTEVVLDRALDLQTVASVELRGLTVARGVTEILTASLVDRELARRAGDSFEDRAWAANRRDCPDCRLRVTCESCHTLRIAGSTYRRGRVLVAVEAVGKVNQTALNPFRRQVLVTDDAGVTELSAWIDGDDDQGVISVGADLLAGISADAADHDRPMLFKIKVQAQAEQAVRGTWAIRQAGS
ncbi:MAG TPA: hypothetical protein VHM23_20775 [Actinomycetota bacterium]|nr:hypothetical protein [Actinomycetota bacterium]